MAYGEKYYHDYCDLQGIDQRVSILQQDYEGPAMRAKAGPNPFVVSYESSSDFKFDPIRASKATVTFIYDHDFNFDEIWDSDERTYKVEKYHDGLLEWTGYLIPNGFSHLMQAGVKYAQMEASDGLSTLESMPFLDTNGNTYGTQDLVYNNGLLFPFSLIATEILRKLELDLNTWISVDAYEQSMSRTGGREGDPLSNSFVNVKTYINDKTNNRIPYWRDAEAVWDCARVMRNLLLVWGAKLYQEGGVWRIKRVNADSAKTDKLWRIFNTLNVYIGNQPIEPDFHIPCNSMTDILIGRDNVIQMDRVFEAVRINYTYAFERDAQQSENMIRNPNFAHQGSVSPIDWEAWGFSFTPPIWFYYIPDMTGERTDGVTTGVSITNGADERRELQYAHDLPVNAGDNLYMEWWERIDQGHSGGMYSGVYTIFLETVSRVSGGGREGGSEQTTRIFLGNDGIQRAPTRDEEGDYNLGAQWSEDRVFFFSYPDIIARREDRYIANSFWVKVVLQIPEIPETGNLRIRVHGAGRRNPSNSGLGGASKPFPGFYPDGNTWKRGNKYYTDLRPADFRELSVTGFFLGIAKDTSNELVPADHNYTVFNEDGEYTDRFEPIEIFNGDAEDPNHVSNIRVPSAGDNPLIWTNWENTYQDASLGLILAYSIMNQYNKPYRMIEGTIAVPNFRFGSVVTFESLPDEKFIVQRGEFTDYSRYGNFSGTLVRLVDDEEMDGGLDNGNTTDPLWYATGDFRCRKNSRTGVNTGMVQEREVDINPSSRSITRERWVDRDEDLVMCPIGQPSDYWFGTDGIVLDTDNLDYAPVLVEGNNVTVRFSNPGGEYLYFLHRVELGVIIGVYTPVQPEIISTFQYLSDVTIGGFDYRVFRQNYPTGQFEDGDMTFIFS